jgi:hypothetical protein
MPLKPFTPCMGMREARKNEEMYVDTCPSDDAASRIPMHGPKGCHIQPLSGRARLEQAPSLSCAARIHLAAGYDNVIDFNGMGRP